MDLVGKMRSVVYMCLNLPTAQGSGYTDNYGVLLSTRGALKKSSGSRALVYGEIEGQSTLDLIVRYQRAIELNVSISTKFVIDNVWYTVSSWEKVDELNYYYKFKVNRTEPVAAGSVDLSTVIGAGVQEPLYLTAMSGTSTITDPLLQSGNVSIMLVAKSGSIYKQVAGAPGNFEFSFSAGVITFSIPFNSSETVYVLYKITS